ncbi:hypothetical protein [Scytonema sp. PCC 10023]|uniref:hypothetical protein n=1 Tax=Scytonema sp. PCC 10023 TaxID=1680591 RepID=UPI0039C71E59
MTIDNPYDDFTNQIGLLYRLNYKLKLVLFGLFPDTPVILTVWENLVTKYQVMGKQAHDRRLVAAMISHEMTHLLTFNTVDFKRFSEITAVDPRTIVPPP